MFLRPDACSKARPAFRRPCSPNGRPMSCMPMGILRAVKAAGLYKAGQAGDVDADRADIARVHGERVLGLGTDLIGRGRRNRGQDHVALLKCSRKLLLDLALGRTRLLVVGVVIARGEHIGNPAWMRRWTSGPKPSERGLDVQVDEVVAGVRGAVAVLDAVKARQVGRRLGPRTGCNRFGRGVVGERQRDLKDPRRPWPCTGRQPPGRLCALPPRCPRRSTPWAGRSSCPSCQGSGLRAPCPQTGS